MNDADDLVAACVGIGFEAVGLRLQGALVFGGRLADVEGAAAAAGTVALSGLGVNPPSRDVQASGFGAARWHAPFAYPPAHRPGVDAELRKQLIMPVRRMVNIISSLAS